MMNMLEELEKYKVKGRFEFKISDSLSQVCNAPRNSSGIYLVYADVVNKARLIYIGISGREGEDGEIVHRQDGLGGRIVNGKQFGKNRRISWPLKMKHDGIRTLKIKWYVTHGTLDQDFPRPIERLSLQTILLENGSLPSWNNEV
jgi:hypothetical protein